MPTEFIKLKQDSWREWRLYTPKGHVLAGPFHGSEHAAIEWARCFISSWYNFSIELDGETNA